eukprot:gnl/Hemi2/25890_TR8702_c0_g1_i1.p1 gnl/Hemi2/25890_TR8702_c0_g1~~gnl/Hemi2/25890_TR8702_c0_g1_i1.p1  ORF type:complete len:264 (+),score=11.12 gnl/Hemi2/25890_TR8702_c0_g1_i1:58-849(+)
MLRTTPALLRLRPWLLLCASLCSKGGKTIQAFRSKRQAATVVGANNSSTKWLRRSLTDPYTHLAHESGLRCRSAYKLQQMDDQLKFLRPGKRVLDLGAAPGGWALIALDRVTKDGAPGQVVCIDLQKLDPIPGVTMLCHDITDVVTATLSAATALTHGRADVVISDCAPATGGIGDHLRYLHIAESALSIAANLLVSGGCFLVKITRGEEDPAFRKNLLRFFTEVQYIKPVSSHASSAEVYLFGRGFKPLTSPSAKPPEKKVS